MRSKYNYIHALAAVLVLGASISKGFWHNFIHGGFPTPPPVNTLFLAIAAQVGLLGMLLLVLWASTFFCSVHPANATPPVRNAHPIRYALVAFIPIALVAFLLAGASEWAFKHIFNLPVHEQDMILWLKPTTYPLSMRLLLMAVAVVEAPLLEELLFRGIIFRGLTPYLPLSVAMILSGLAFALIHVNAVTLLPLWFLGTAFAWLYAHTQCIWASVTVHFLFNVLNLAFILFGLTI